MMSKGLPFFVARRYLFSKKKNNIINLISGISVVGIALAAMAMICVLSGFNGIRDLIGDLFTTFDAPLVVQPIKGKEVDAQLPSLLALRHDPDVMAASNIYEGDALILFKGHPKIVRLKGVDNAYDSVTHLRSILVGDGNYELQRANLFYGIPSIGLASDFGSLNFGSVQLCVPKKGERINVMNPIESINTQDINSSGLCFEVRQQRYDASMMICALPFAQELFSAPRRITQVELALRPGADVATVKTRLRQLLGQQFEVLDRYEQHRDTFRVMNIEKLFAFLFLAFIALVATLNIVGSVSMLMIDKAEDMRTLRYLGLTEKDVVRIFLYEGRMIILLGAVIGISLGLLLSLGQQQFGWLKFGNSQEAFIISAYPMSIHVQDVLLTFVTIVIVGFIAVWYPVKYFARKKIGQMMS